MARAAGRARSQRFRVTSALKKGPRATIATTAETSRRSETSGAGCRTSQDPAVPRDKRAQKRISHQGRRPRGKRARREPNFGWRPVRAARRSSRTAESGRPPYAEVAFSGIKGGGAFWILQSRRSEHPHGGKCTERHRARTHCGTSNARSALRIYADLRGYAQGKQGLFETLTLGTGGVYWAGLAAWIRLITGTKQGRRDKPALKKLLASAAVRRHCGETKACSQ